MTPTYAAYEFLSLVIPGGLLLAAAVYGWDGWRYDEPGATALVGILAASYVVGQANAAIANLLEPVLWLRRPGSRQDPTWGMFGPKGTYSEQDREHILGQLRARYGDVDFPRGYNLAYTELYQLGKDEQLKLANQSIGFLRNMTCACVIATCLVGAYAAAGREALPAAIWIPIGVAASVLFAYRYRRFWRRFGDYVIRGFSVLPARPSERTQNHRDET